jgi:hypothetical protein
VSINRNLNLVLFFSFVYFISCYAISVSWYYNGYFDVYNIFFDTDPNKNLSSFAHGRGMHAVSHAFLELFSVTIRIIEFAFSSLSTISNRLEFRELIALAISPIFSALTIVCFYIILMQLKIKTIDANIFTLIFATSFSNVIFAIIPETYAISCFLIALLVYYYLRSGQMKQSGSPLAWFIIAILLTGITITNICIFFLIFSAHLLKNEKFDYYNAFRKASFYSISAVLLVFIYYKMSHFLFSAITGIDIKMGGGGGIDWIAKYVTTSLYKAGINIINLFSASINAFLAASPTIIAPYIFSKEQVSYNLLSFTRYKEDYLWLSSVAILCSVFAYASKEHLKEKRWHDLYLISGLIIVFNFSLHVLFGREMFMYTQHWIIPLCLILVPVLSGRRALSITFLLLLVGVNLQFLFNVEQLVTK